MSVPQNQDLDASGVTSPSGQPRCAGPQSARGPGAPKLVAHTANRA
jgi:hypothetical protein